MAAPPDELPQWATDGGAIITVPSTGFRNAGYVPNTAAGAGVMNWWKNKSYQWLQWLKVDGGCAQREASGLLEHTKVSVFAGTGDSFRGFSSTPDGLLHGVGDGGRIHVSDDGGTTWGIASSVGGGYSLAFMDVQYMSGFGLVAVGENGEVQACTNTALSTWVKKPTGITDTLLCIGSSGLRCIAAGMNGVTIGCSDAAFAWSAGGVVNSGNFAPNSIGYIPGVWLLAGNSSPANRDTTIFRSTDNGATWVPVPLSSGSVLGPAEFCLGIAVVQDTFVAHIAGGSSHRTITSKNGLTWTTGGTCPSADSMMLACGTHLMALAPKEVNKVGVASYDCGATWLPFVQPGFGSAGRIQMMSYTYSALGTRKWLVCGANGVGDDRGKVSYSRYFAI